MIVVPIKLNKQDSAVAPIFGKAKWFAFIENGEISIERNECQGGAEVVRWFLKKGVKALLMQKMSQSPYQLIKEDGSIAVFYVGSERILLPDVLKKYEDEFLIIVDDSNSDEIIKSKNK